MVEKGYKALYSWNYYWEQDISIVFKFWISRNLLMSFYVLKSPTQFLHDAKQIYRSIHKTTTLWTSQVQGVTLRVQI